MTTTTRDRRHSALVSLGGFLSLFLFVFGVRQWPLGGLLAAFAVRWFQRNFIYYKK
ncbi:hypothetical protein psal_cds_1424 [Pandoravirus salinus]|uniref:Uncharacterized protein n=1 Tax=Pandoravirus salinus TaxID=1349410 RepID=S4VZS0_9VIRU|nr:hypothetical protein psal_cds_1424 [Pandoravirus salinus]AGO85868.2 hypothetical protein psal_cds_1424 [Pandoravirus salinus]